MQLDLTVPGTTDRKVTIRFGKTDRSVRTDLWGRMIDVNNKTVADEMWAIREEGYIACAKAVSRWEAIRSKYTKEIAMDAGAAAVASVLPDAASWPTTEASTAPVTGPAAPTEPPAPPKADRNVVTALVKKWFNFLSEFHFRPQARLLNSIFNCANANNVRELVIGYFSLINHPDAQALADKASSSEFKELAAASSEVPMDSVINKRLVIFYGDPGTGKTTKAMELFPEADVIPCHPGMLPDDLYRQFDFTDDTGKPVFKDSDLVKAMKEGRRVILDEINLLSLECLRSIQALLDNKTNVQINGKPVEIKEGFMVVGTMNLDIGGVVYGLPDPLVDRAAVIKKFELSPDEVAKIACPEAF